MSKATLQDLKLGDLIPTKNNPRKFPPKDPELKALAVSIGEQGVITPVVARPHPKKKGKYELLAGERRWRASKIADKATIPTIVRNLDDANAVVVTVLENNQREDLTPLEESAGVKALIDIGWEAKQIAKELGRSPGWVSLRSTLIKLTPAWRKAIETATSIPGQLKATHLDLVARLPAATQDLVLQDRPWNGQLPTHKRFRGLLAEYSHELRKAPWKLDDATLLPKAGACNECLKRSGSNPVLFADMQADIKAKGEQCLDHACWDKKTRANVDAALAAARKEHGKSLVCVVESSSALRKQYGAIDGYYLDKCTKAASGAVPVFHVDGNDAGQVTWGKDWRRARASKRSAATADKKGKPTPLKERRKALANRRNALIITGLRQLLSDDKQNKALTPPADVLTRLLLQFGTWHRESHSHHPYYKDGGSWKSFHKPTPRDARLQLWRSVALVLSERLKFFTQDSLPIADAKEVARLIGKNWKALEKHAAEEIPTPKGWAKLNANGTPKADKKSPRKKK